MYAPKEPGQEGSSKREHTEHLENESRHCTLHSAQLIAAMAANEDTLQGEC